MKQHISKVTGTILAIMCFSLGACSGKHEKQGKQIGKNIDHFEKDVKETANNTKENVQKKAHELHDQSKDKAHELIDKS